MPNLHIYRSLNTVVAQLKKKKNSHWQFDTTFELKNVTATSNNTSILVS